jgi:bifunctional non-homologous end joining protein LigD
VPARAGVRHRRPPDEQLARGKIDVVLQGSKLRGGFTLI